jgi:DNA-binding MarR family transcriptional regulator
MVTSSDLPKDRLAIGQLLGRLLREFRVELFEPAAANGYPDLRESHLLILGNIGIHGMRLTELASRSQLGLAATSEMVDNLVALGYFERRPDERDRRAKLIFPTDRGRALLRDAGNRVAEIEQGWAALIGSAEFNRACANLQRLLDELDAKAPAVT